MPYEIPQRLRSLEPYKPSPNDYDIILNANESFIDAGSRLQGLVGAAVKSVKLNRYPDPMCTRLREAYARLYSLDPERLTVSNGSDEMIALIISAIAPDNGTVLIYEPDFSMYRFYAQLYGRKAIVVDKGPGLAVDIDLTIEQARRADVVIFSNPCNPTSLVVERSEVLRLVSSTDALVVVDEAYMEFSDQSVMNVAHEYDNLIVLRTCSKAIGLAALRLGVAVAGKRLTRLMQSVKSPFNVNAVSQAIGEAVLSQGDYIRGCVKAIIESRDSLYSALCVIKSERVRRIFRPDTNFVLIWADGARGLCEGLAGMGISVRGLGDYIRVTAGSPEENARFISAFKALLEE